MKAKALTQELVPHRCLVSADGRLQPLEFTTDALAANAWHRLSGNSALIKHIGKTLAKRRFSAVFGIGIYKREASAKFATAVYIEETDFEKKSSVVHVLPAMQRVSGRLIPTLWTRVNAGNGCCTQSCVAYCSHSGGGIGYCGHRKSGHIGCV